MGPLDSAGRATAPKRRAGGFAAFLSAQRSSPEDRVLAVVQRFAAQVEEYQREMFGETAQERAARERQEHLDKLHDLYGLRIGPANPAPAGNESEPAQSADRNAKE